MSLVASSSKYLSALKGELKGSPPVWFMRQAGRYMPEYLAFRSRYSFLEMVRSPKLIEEVTLLPIEKFGFDAAILFSDILLILETIGCRVEFLEGEGPKVTRGEKLSPGSVSSLSYVGEGIGRLKKRLSVPLIGFAGGPFTVASYLYGGVDALKKEMQMRPKEMEELFQLLTQQTLEYAALQVEAGIDAFQLFDTWAGLLSPNDFNRFVIPSYSKIVQFTKERRVPIILFTRHTAGHLEALAGLNPEAIGCDSNLSLSKARQIVGPKIALQGNLDPASLYGKSDAVSALLEEMRGDPAFIFNLGHGMFPDLNPEAVERAIHTIRNFR